MNKCGFVHLDVFNNLDGGFDGVVMTDSTGVLQV